MSHFTPVSSISDREAFRHMQQSARASWITEAQVFCSRLHTSAVPAGPAVWREVSLLSVHTRLQWTALKKGKKYPANVSYVEENVLFMPGVRGQSGETIER